MFEVLQEWFWDDNNVIEVDEFEMWFHYLEYDVHFALKRPEVVLSLNDI